MSLINASLRRLVFFCHLRRVPKQEAAWKEQIARMLLVYIRTAASSVRELSNDATSPTLTDPNIPAPSVRGLRDVISDAVGALAIIAGSSGVLYPGAAVQST